MLHHLCRIAVLGAALAAASVSHAQLISGGSSSGSGGTPGGSSGQLQFNNAGAFGGGAGTAWDDTNRALTISGATVTSSKPLLDLSQTWNAGAEAFSALKLNVTDTASAAGSLLLDLQVGGSSKFNVSKGGQLTLGSLYFGGTTGSIYVNGSLRADYGATTSSVWTFQAPLAFAADSFYYSLGAALDVRLYRDAASTLALRHGVNAQALNVYNTYTDASNYERGFIGFSSNTFYIQTQAAGTGTARDLYIRSASNALYFGTGGAQNWQISSGNLLASTDNTVDIGSSGTYRPRNVYVAGKINGAIITMGAADDAGISRLGAASLAIGNGTAGDYSGKLTLGSLYFGGTTGSIYVNGSLRADYGATTSSVWTFQAPLAFAADSSYYTLGAALDVRLYRDAANTLALRRGVNAQALNVYNTWTDASNYEAIMIGWGSNIASITSTNAGTGTSRVLRVVGAGGAAIGLGDTSAAVNFGISPSGHFLAGTDNTYDIGASGANRARNAYLAGKIVTGSTTLHETSVALANGAAAATGTLTNAPAAGNPTKWFPINDNGTTRYVPAW